MTNRRRGRHSKPLPPLAPCYQPPRQRRVSNAHSNNHLSAMLSSPSTSSSMARYRPSRGGGSATIIVNDVSSTDDIDPTFNNTMLIQIITFVPPAPTPSPPSTVALLLLPTLSHPLLPLLLTPIVTPATAITYSNCLITPLYLICPPPPSMIIIIPRMFIIVVISVISSPLLAPHLTLQYPLLSQLLLPVLL